MNEAAERARHVAPVQTRDRSSGLYMRGGLKGLGVMKARPRSACLTSRPPVFINLCCKLVSDQLLILFGSPSRRHKLPRL